MLYLARTEQTVLATLHYIILQTKFDKHDCFHARPAAQNSLPNKLGELLQLLTCTSAD